MFGAAIYGHLHHTLYIDLPWADFPHLGQVDRMPTFPEGTAAATATWSQDSIRVNETQLFLRATRLCTSPEAVNVPMDAASKDVNHLDMWSLFEACS
jgi:hypothetical protein